MKSYKHTGREKSRWRRTTDKKCITHRMLTAVQGTYYDPLRNTETIVEKFLDPGIYPSPPKAKLPPTDAQSDVK